MSRRRGDPALAVSVTTVPPSACGANSNPSRCQGGAAKSELDQTGAGAPGAGGTGGSTIGRPNTFAIARPTRRDAASSWPVLRCHGNENHCAGHGSNRAGSGITTLGYSAVTAAISAWRAGMNSPTIDEHGHGLNNTMSFA